jgi:tetrahydromethanopterin S-methyltransferase subunit H
MKIIYTRTAYQEYESEIIFHIAPFCDAKWIIKQPSDIYPVFDEWVNDDCIEVGYDMKLITTDTAVIEHLWGSSIKDLMTYINEVRDITDSPVIRQCETEASMHDYRHPIPVNLKVHYKDDGEPIVYVEVKWEEMEINDNEWTIYDCESYEVNTTL